MTAYVFLAKFAEFYYHKIYETKEVHDNLSILMDERNPCGFMVTQDINIFQCHMIKM